MAVADPTDAPGERSNNPVRFGEVSRSRAIDPAPTPALPAADYEADDVLVVSEPERLRALADELRGKIIVLLQQRARSATDLADELGLPKGTVAHHVKVLEKAGLIRVVRTRRVRAVTERFYGRTARLFLVETEDQEANRSFAAGGLKAAAYELARAGGVGEPGTFGLVHARLSEDDARGFERRVRRLLDEMRARETPDGEPYALVAALYASEAHPGRA
jgi:DNA-binding transcriptional ArsR family regulator